MHNSSLVRDVLPSCNGMIQKIGIAVCAVAIVSCCSPPPSKGIQLKQTSMMEAYIASSLYWQEMDHVTHHCTSISRTKLTLPHDIGQNKLYWYARIHAPVLIVICVQAKGSIQAICHGLLICFCFCEVVQISQGRKHVRILPISKSWRWEVSIKHESLA